MGDFLNNYPESSNQNSYSAASAQPATSTSTSAFGSTNNQESQQAGNSTSYANAQIDPQLVSNSFNTTNAGKQSSSYGQNQAMASYDMQDGQNNNNNNNMNYDPSYNTFNSNMGGYQNSYSDMSYGSANQQQQHAQQQQHFYDRQQQQGSGFQREVSDNFGTVSAGPPSPGKMDMLPHGHTNHYTSSSATNPSNMTSTSQQQQQQHQKNRPSVSNPAAGGEYDGSSQASHLARAPTTKGSSTTSEFTKRKNWSQRIVEEMQDVLHVLSPSGIFLFISPSIYEITGYTPEELVGRGITDFIERDDIDNFTRDFSESIQTNQALTTYIRFRRKDEQGVLFEVTGQPYYTTATSSPQNNMVRTSSSSSNTNDGNSPADATMSSRKPPPSSSEAVCKCFFAMARLYPGKNNAMLDSFLELKMENEKLRERLAEIYREIEGDNVEANIVAGTSIIDTTASISTMGSEGQNEPRQISGYPSRLLGQNQNQNQNQPIQPSPSNPYAMSTENEVPKSATSSNFPSTFYKYPTSSAQNPYSTQNLQQIQPNNNNNNNQYNADASTSQLRGTAISQDSLLVSSAGLLPSSGNTYGALGIGISNNAHRNNNNSSGPSNQYTSNNAQKGASNQDYAGGDTSMRDDGDPANKKKKPKKQRVDEGEFVCRDCGTVDSPEWRRGPQGPKTLCNACGLRWAKKNKQSRNSIGGMEGIA